MQRLEVARAKSPHDRVIHICYSDEPKLRIMTVWETQDNFRAMAPTLLPILNDAGIQVSEPPQILTVHVILRA